METVIVNLQVFFEDPFWVGIFERINKGKISASKVTFGSEPKEYDVLKFILKNYYKINFSPEIIQEEVLVKKINPKRMQRKIKKQVSDVLIGTKSQQALKLQHEKMKTERKIRKKEVNELEKKRMFELKQQKKKEKHRGR